MLLLSSSFGSVGRAFFIFAVARLHEIALGFVSLEFLLVRTINLGAVSGTFSATTVNSVLAFTDVNLSLLFIALYVELIVALSAVASTKKYVHSQSPVTEYFACTEVWLSHFNEPVL